MMAKVEYIKFKSFLDDSWKQPKEKSNHYLPLIGGSLSLGTSLNLIFNRIVSSTTSQSVPVNGVIQDKVAHAFDPLFEFIAGIAYPVCFLSISAGCVLIMMGQKHKGLNLIRWACIGFVGLQFAPGLMSILMEVGRAIKGV
jgi:hypothetical protein